MSKEPENIKNIILNEAEKQLINEERFKTILEYLKDIHKGILDIKAYCNNKADGGTTKNDCQNSDSCSLT